MFALDLKALGTRYLHLRLPVIGDRAHLAVLPGLTLDTHIQDVVSLLEYEELRDVTLVGHSYGGMVVSGVAERAADRLRQLVYLDAFVPQDGQSLLDLLPPQARVAFEQNVIKAEDGRELIPPLAYASVGRISAEGLPEEEVRRLLGKRVPQAFATYAQPLHLANPAVKTLPHTFIFCSDKGPGDPFGFIAPRVRAAGWGYAEISTGHFPMLTTPDEAAGALLALH